MAFLPLLFLAAQMFAQQNQCGTTFNDQLMTRDRLKANIAYAEKNGFPENVVTYVPVFFHLAAATDGTGRGKMQDIFNALCTINNDYAEHDIQFYLSPHPTLGLVDATINNDNVFDNQTNTFLMNFKRHNNALNYYVVGNAQSGNQQPGTTLAYYTSLRDWIVINKTYTAYGDNTIAHETGHFFSLAHTFLGWESDAQDSANEPPCFESGDPGWPCAPAISPGGTPTEKADGSNCSTAADMICDTPPDYNFGYCANSCVAYTGGAKDPNCLAVDPMENNFMSYYSGCADFDFTQGQINAVKADILSSERNYLDNNFVPAATSITTPANLLVSPAESEVLQDDDTAVLTWNAVPGATYYYVEVDRVSTYSSALGQSHVVSNATSLTVTGLTANKKYYWRVRPFNEYYVCATPKQRTFNTGVTSGVDQIESVNDWSLVPNPVAGEQQVQLNINTSTTLEVNINMLDATGRMVYNQNSVQLNAGNSNIQLSTAGLSTGIYFVQLQSGDRIETRRLSVVGY